MKLYYDLVTRKTSWVPLFSKDGVSVHNIPLKFDIVCPKSNLGGNIMNGNAILERRRTQDVFRVTSS